VVGLALAPLGHFLPGKRQRKLARLRECAALKGLFVEFRNIPGEPVGQVRDGRVIYYGKRLPANLGAAVERGAWTLSDGEWVGVQTRQPVPLQLRELPADILAGSIDEASCGIYWTESGEEESVERIRCALEGWTADLAV